MKTLPAVFLVLLLAGCSEGPCEHSYFEPILNVRSVTDGKSGAPIPFVLVRYMMFNGLPISSEQLSLVSTNVEAQGDSLRCTVPFGFGYDPGIYRFRVEAPGYLPQTIVYDAEYKTFEGGCPSCNDDGLDIDIVMTPQENFWNSANSTNSIDSRNSINFSNPPRPASRDTPPRRG